MGTDLELCLDFADTVDWRTSDHPVDTLGSYQALLQWGNKRGLVDQRAVAEIGSSLTREESADVLADAVRLREAIYRIFSSIAHQKRAPPNDLAAINEYLGRGLARTAVKEAGDGYGWDWGGEVAPDMMLLPVVRSAAVLLTSDDLRWVRECAKDEEGCGSLFLDSSKSQSRRWCSMTSCGNRAKSKAFYDRHLRNRARQ